MNAVGIGILYLVLGNMVAVFSDALVKVLDFRVVALAIGWMADGNRRLPVPSQTRRVSRQANPRITAQP